MAQSLDQFIAEVTADIQAFEAEYRKEHAANPEHYPLEMSDDNAGVWAEFFIDFMTRSKPNAEGSSHS